MNYGAGAAATGLRDHVGVYLRFAGLAWRAGPRMAVLAAAGVLLSAAAPLAVVGVVGVLVAKGSAITHRGLGSADGRSALLWVLMAAVLLFAQWTAGTMRTAGATALGERIDALLQRDLMAAVMKPEGIAHLENSRTVDLLDVGRDTFRASWTRPGRLATTLSRLLANWMIVVGAVVTLVNFNPWVGLTVAAAGLWAAREERVASRVEAAHHYGRSESSRRLDYLYDLGATAPAAKEVRVFGLTGFLLGAYGGAWRETMKSVLTPPSRRPKLAAAALAVAVLGSLGWVAASTSGGHTPLPPGDAAVCVQALMLVISGFGQSAWAGLQTELALATLRTFDEALGGMSNAGTGDSGATLGPLEQAIMFEDVSFTYPNATSDSLTVLNLELAAGRSLAIVGANGAGKTTLVKLLCKLYQPTAGRITVDGQDLAGTDGAAWRRQIAAVFTDSTRFSLSAGANIGFGRVEAMNDEAGIIEAARDAGIDGDLAGLSAGLATTLSAEYAGGTDLSGGQWQKVALARALFAVRHGARVLILDEPAAHLDARAEARLYERFLELTEGLTTIVISHRFSTVRQASSIAVLDGGRVVEQGTHDELMGRAGVYAHMFNLQAERFADPDPDSDSDSAPGEAQVPVARDVDAAAEL